MTPFFQYTPNGPIDHPVVNSLESRLEKLSPGAMEAAARFPLRLPREFAKRISWEQEGPLQREFFPTEEELVPTPGFVTDPLEEGRAQVAPGLIGKYSGRVLLRVTTHCAIHCRFCFRRHAPSHAIPRNLQEWRPALQWIANEPTLREVIFSGGDPLTRTDRHLSLLAHRLAEIPHLTRLRLHTRMPVVVPERVTSTLTDWLKGSRLTPVVVIHVNHADELDAHALSSLARLVDAGIPVLSQSVLLKGVNDDWATLMVLFERLVDARVLPYYLHMLDPVAGAAHFHVEDQVAMAIMVELRTRLPGYAVPRLVREVPGEGGKRLL